MDSFYKEENNEERYSGLSRRRPLVPENEIWVFQSPDGQATVVYGGNPDTLPPAATLFGAMRIYKFWRRRDIPWSVTFFKDTTCNVTVETNAILFLRDPIQFMTYLQIQGPDKLKSKDLKDFFPELKKALDAALSDEGGNRTSPTKAVGGREVGLPLALSQLQPEEDILSHYTRGKLEIQKVGLDARIIVQAVSVSDTYKKLVQGCLLVAQKHLRPLKEALLATASRVEGEKILPGIPTDLTEQGPLSQKVALQKELYAEYLHHVEQLRPQLYGVIEEAMKKNSLNIPTLRTAIFHEMLYQVIEQVIDQVTTAHSPSTAEISSNPAYERAEQIKNFYLTAQADGWELFPKSPEKVKEEINIGLDSESQLLLTIPGAYPQSTTTPGITNVKMQRQRLPQEKINKVIGPILQMNNYTLTILVKAVIDALAPENEEDITKRKTVELP